MEKLPMCRLCLVQNVRMYIVVNRQLHQLYEKLTDIPFVTEDCRPILACFLCLSKLKRCWRLLRKCLESDEQFVKIMKEEYEPDPAINLDCFELYSGLSTSPIQRMSTVDECQTESNNITIKQEIPDVCEGLDEFIEIEEEHQSDELEPDHLYQSSLEVEVDIPPQHSESDSEDDKPLIEFETEEVEEEEVYKMELNATETKNTYVTKRQRRTRAGARRVFSCVKAGGRRWRGRRLTNPLALAFYVSDNSGRESMQPPTKKAKSHDDTLSSHHTHQSSQWSQNIIIETGHHQDQLNTRHTINVRVNNSKKERQKRYRERNREKLKQCEAERRKRKQHSQSIAGPSSSSNTNTLEVYNEEKRIAGPSTSSNTNILEVNNEEIITALQKKREYQRRYREQNRDKLKQREAERRRRLQNAEMITELSTSPNVESPEIIY